MGVAWNVACNVAQMWGENEAAHPLSYQEDELMPLDTRDTAFSPRTRTVLLNFPLMQSRFIRNNLDGESPNQQGTKPIEQQSPT